MKKNNAVDIAKEKKLQTNNEINIAHAYKSMKTSSSKITIVFKHGMEVDLKQTLDGNNITTKSKNIKMKKKLSKIKGLEITPYLASYDMNNDIIGKSKKKHIIIHFTKIMIPKKTNSNNCFKVT